MKIIILFLITANALNIILSSTDSWVTKNIRFLYQDLIAQNHTVLVVGPLYQTIPNTEIQDVGMDIETNMGTDMRTDIQADIEADIETNSETDMGTEEISTPPNDGGDFGYLLPCNQLYYKNLAKFKLPRVAKNILSSLKLKEFETNFNPLRINNTIQFGNDPLDNNYWYVNTKNPVNMLSIFIDNILATYYPEFVADLVIFGPVEGPLEPRVSQDISKFLLSKDIPTIMATTSDNHHISYQDEIFRKPNDFTRVSAFVNSKIIGLMNKLIHQKQVDNTESLDQKQMDKPESLLPENHLINLQFPPLFCSRCFLKKNSAFKFSNFNQLFGLSYNQFSLNDGRISFTSQAELSLVSKSETEVLDTFSNKKVNGELDDEFFVDRNSNYYKQRQTAIQNAFMSAQSQEVLNSCDVVLRLDYLYELDEEFDYDVVFT